TLLSGNVPKVSAIGGEWIVLGLARSERISDNFRNGYYNNLVKFLKANGSEKMHRTKSTENSRAIIALSALGYDATDVAGYNLLLPLCDMNFLDKQGINGSIWALIAFDTVNYDIPIVDGVKEQTTREKLIQNILSEQTENGGWLLDDEIGDIDLTAMAIVALAPYVQTNSDVKAAVDKALEFLSKQQRADGGYMAYGKSTSESCAQVVVALTSLGIDPNQDERFIKNGHSVLDKLLSFYQDGAFKHVMNESVGQMATEQAYYALASYYRFLDGKTALYDMSDVKMNTDTPVIGDDNKPTVPPVDDKEDTTKPPMNSNDTSTEPSTDNKSNVPAVDNSDHPNNAVDNNAKSPETGNSSVVFIILIFAATGIVLCMVFKRKNRIYNEQVR
ncbi:MAG: terpene cyclase/mutase family protein, partial [Eubacterium sp.]|nr:terpene cyclase/mutase family protein [Eubacterium sp.]